MRNPEIITQGNQAGNGWNTQSAANHSDAVELSRANGGCTSAEEITTGEGNVGVDTIHQNLRDPSQRLAHMKSTWYKRGRSVANPLYDRKVYSRPSKSRASCSKGFLQSFMFKGDRLLKEEG